MKGRKPKPNAQRRGGTQPAPIVPATVLDAKVVEVPRCLEKPPQVASNPLQSECWDAMVGLGFDFEPCDIPLLESYCFWYSVLRKAEGSVIHDDGSVHTVVYEVDEEGNPKRVIGPNPDLRTAEKATNMLRQIGDVLRINPTARERSKLMDAVTKSTQADVVNKTIEGYEQFKAAQKALNAAK